MTESEAKQKWCPMFNGWIHHTENVGHYKCKGSACMMWRQKSITEIDAKKQGYCGLAGKP